MGRFPDDFCRQMNHWLGPGEARQLLDALATRSSLRGVRLQRYAPATDSAHHTAAATGEARQTSDQLPPTARGSSGFAIARPLSPVPDALARQLGSPVAWSDDGYYLPPATPLGSSIFQHTGAIYIQEPSAMAVVLALQPQPGERILDLCAAPGGKAAAIGRRMGGRGLLVVNDIHPTRVNILAQTMERCGVPAVISNESPARLAEAWPGQFDAVLVDAPCSGEGMFRKEAAAASEWTADTPLKCSLRQQDILRHAVNLVRDGGRLVYSTCTLNPIENEQIVAWMHQELGIAAEPLPHWPGWQQGRADWAKYCPDVANARRLWPHVAAGEGHFVARMRCRGPRAAVSSLAWRHRDAACAADAHHSNLAATDWQHQLHPWLAEVPALWRSAHIHRRGLWLDLLDNLPPLSLRLLRSGVKLADVADNGRLHPAHALAMAVDATVVRQPLALTAQAADVWLGGGTLPSGEQRGVVWMHLDGLPLGWGNAVAGRINNRLPKGLRRPTTHAPQQ